MRTTIGRSRAAFTLTELLIALAIGLLVVQIAFASFVAVQRYINRIQRLEAANQVLQSVVNWHIHNGIGTYPSELIGPALPSVPPYRLNSAGEDIVRRAPQRIMVGSISGSTVTIFDYSEAARAAFVEGGCPAITGWTRGDNDPRYLAEITLPSLP